jgi:hypothetical protein
MKTRVQTLTSFRGLKYFKHLGKIVMTAASNQLVTSARSNDQMCACLCCCTPTNERTEVYVT